MKQKMEQEVFVFESEYEVWERGHLREIDGRIYAFAGDGEMPQPPPKFPGESKNETG